jgi:uncharacterized membrane protein (UPF0182 family)
MMKKPSPLALTFIILAVLAGALVALSGFYVDWLWFKSVGFTDVWSTVLFTKAALFVAAGLLTSLVISLNIYIAFRRRPFYVPTSIEADNLERYRATIDPIRKLAFAGIAVVLFYFGGSSATTLWSSWLLFKNSTPFGVKDPQFGMDISFFAFRLPFFQTLIGWAISTLILATIASVAVHYIYGGIRPQVREDRTTVAARVQLSVLLGLIVLLNAMHWLLKRAA